MKTTKKTQGRMLLVRAGTEGKTIWFSLWRVFVLDPLLPADGSHISRLRNKKGRNELATAEKRLCVDDDDDDEHWANRRYRVIDGVKCA
jgi:hypothetical protein